MLLFHIGRIALIAHLYCEHLSSKKREKKKNSSKLRQSSKKSAQSLIYSCFSWFNFRMPFCAGKANAGEDSKKGESGERFSEVPTYAALCSTNRVFSRLPCKPTNRARFRHCIIMANSKVNGFCFALVLWFSLSRAEQCLCSAWL